MGIAIHLAILRLQEIKEKVADDFGDAGSRTTVRRKRSFGRLGDISCSRDES